MIKIIIADDEKIIRQRLVERVDWDALGYNLVDQASNGMELLDKCLKHRPDAILTDIKMPQMDGIELVSEINRHNLDIEVIALSGFSKFEYAQKLMHNGAFAYLLKPIDKIELKKCLIKLKEKIKNKQLVEKRIKTEALRNFIMKSAPLSQKTIDSINYSTLIYLCPDESGLVCHRLVLEDIKKCISLAFDSMTLVNQSENHLVMMIEADKMNDIKNILHDAFVCVNDSISAIYNTTVSLYYLPISRNIENLRTIDLFSSIKQFKAFLGRMRLNCINELKFENRTNQYMYAEKYEANIIKGIINKNFEIIENSLLHLHTEMLESLVSFTNFKQCYFQLMNSIYRNLIEKNLVTDNIKKIIFTLFDGFEHLEFVDSLYEYILNLLLTIYNEVIGIPSEYSDFYLKRTIEFIEKNFNHEIAMKDAAEYIGISYGYLSSIFKKNNSEGFVSLLRKRRIDEAKKLLSETDLKIYEVSEAVGFSNSRYFSEVFCESTGYNPLIYRKTYKN